MKNYFTIYLLAGAMSLSIGNCQSSQLFLQKGAARVAEEQIILEEEEDEGPPAYDVSIIYSRYKELVAVKDEEYPTEFDEAQKAAEELAEAQEEYENGGTAEKLAEAEKDYQKVKQRPNSDGTVALKAAQKKLDAAQQEDDAAMAIVEDKEATFNTKQEISYDAQYNAHLTSLLKLKDEAGLATYRAALQKQILEDKFIFNAIPLEVDAEKEEIDSFIKHLDDTISFFTQMVEEANGDGERRSSRTEHKKSAKVVADLRDILDRKSKGESMSETKMSVAFAQYNADTNRQSYKEAKLLAKTLTGDEKRSAQAYASFFKMTQYQMDKALKEAQPATGASTSALFLTFLGCVLIYLIYDIVTCVKEDRLKYQ